MNRTTIKRIQGAIVIFAPLVVLAGWIYHPYIAYGPDAEAIATAVSADPTRWGLAHLLLAVGFVLMVLAFLAIRIELGDAGEQKWSSIGVPLVVFGGSLSVILPAMEFAPLAAAETGGNIQAAQEALMPWFVPVLLTSGVSLTLGTICFAIGIVHSRILSSGMAWLVVAALGVMVVSRFVPFGVTNYVEGIAGLIALSPLGHAIWSRAEDLEVRRVQAATA